MPTITDEKLDELKTEEQPTTETCPVVEDKPVTDEEVVVIAADSKEVLKDKLKTLLDDAKALAKEAKTLAKDEKPKEEKPKTEVKGLSELLRTLKKANKALSPAERMLRVKYSIMSWNDNLGMEGFAECISGVFEVYKSGKMTLDAIIDKGLQCPCPRHSAAKTAAEMLKHGWIGEA